MEFGRAKKQRLVYELGLRHDRSLSATKKRLISMPACETMQRPGRRHRTERRTKAECVVWGSWSSVLACDGVSTRSCRSLRSPLFSKSGSLTSFISSLIAASWTRLLWLHKIVLPRCQVNSIHKILDSEKIPNKICTSNDFRFYISFDDLLSFFRYF